MFGLPPRHPRPPQSKRPWLEFGPHERNHLRLRQSIVPTYRLEGGSIFPRHFNNPASVARTDHLISSAGFKRGWYFMQKPKHRNKKNLYSPARGRRLNRDKKTTSPPSRDRSSPAVARSDCHQQTETIVPTLDIGTLATKHWVTIPKSIKHVKHYLLARSPDP